MPRQLATFALLVFALPSWGAGEIYCCQDPASGRRICADSVPAQCRGQGHRIFDRAGNLVQEVGPPLTPEQKLLAAEEVRRKKQLEDAQRERRRIDQALLDTYATAEDIDLAQRKAENDVNFSIRTAQAAIEEAQKKRVTLEQEAEFYRKKTMPQDLDKSLRSVKHEIQLQLELIEVKKKDLAAIRAKYDADRRRYFELTGRPAAGQ